MSSRRKAFVEQFKGKIDELDTLLTRNKIFVDRNKGIGIISKEDAIDFGLTGPNLRGSGVELRRAQGAALPHLRRVRFRHSDSARSATAYDRYLCRLEELRQSVRILEQALNKLPGGPINVGDGKGFLPRKDKVLTKMEELIHQFILVTEGIQAPVGEVYFGAENPKGELGFYIQSKGGGVPYRLKIRAPSFVNLSILGKLLPGHMMSDVVAILGSLDFVMGECDR